MISEQACGAADSRENGAALLAALRDETAGCQACRFSRTRRVVADGIGPVGAPVMFIGEGPGDHEDACGEVYTGPSGRLLDRIVEAMGLERARVFLANVVRCRVPEEDRIRKPEIEACREFLEREIAAVDPTVIVPLGAVAWRWFVPQDKRPMRAVRGALYRHADRMLIPTYHPAFLLRKPEFKRDVWNDVRMVMRTAERLTKGETVGAVDTATLGTPARKNGGNRRVREFEERADLFARMADDAAEKEQPGRS